MTWHLSLLLWLPLCFGVITLLGPKRLAPLSATLGCLLSLAYVIGMTTAFDHQAAGLQFVTDRSWIKALGISYVLGVDGLNIGLLLLTAFGWLIATLWATQRTWRNQRLFFFHLLFAQTAVFGALLAQDLVLFTVFFDLMLIPFFFLTAQWGGSGRRQAVIKLVVYTLVGSLLMLVGVVATGVLSTQGNDTSLTFTISELVKTHLGDSTQRWLFLAFAAAFFVKMPSFPFHGWMPDGYKEMPLPALAVFSGILSKLAAYGFLRIAIPLFPAAAHDFQTLFSILAVLSIVYGSAMAFTVTNVRLILGYSSIAQLGFITLGIFALRDAGTQGALLQAVNHGLVVIPAFIVVGILAKRSNNSEELHDMGGLALRAPVLAALFLLLALATLAVPGSANFVGEFLILLGAFQAHQAIAIVASLGVVLASIYTLRLFISSMHNRTGPEVESRELTVKEAFPIVMCVAAILALAFVPQTLLRLSKTQQPQRIQATKQPPVAAQEGNVTPEAGEAQQGEGR